MLAMNARYYRIINSWFFRREKLGIHRYYNISLGKSLEILGRRINIRNGKVPHFPPSKFMHMTMHSYQTKTQCNHTHFVKDDSLLTHNIDE